MESRKIATSSLCINGEEVWLFDRNYNAVLKYNLLTKDVNYICVLPVDDEFYANYQYAKIEVTDNKILLVPNQRKELLIIDKENFKYRYVDLLDRKLNNGLFRSGAWINKEYYLIPSGYNSIVKFDIKNEIILEEIEWKKRGECSKDAFISDFSIEDNRIALLVKPDNSILIYSLKDNDYEKFDSLKTEGDITTIAIIKDMLFAHSRKMGLVKINLNGEEGICAKIVEFNEDLYLYKFGNRLMLDYINENKIIICNQNLEIEYVNVDCTENNEEYEYFVYQEEYLYKNKRLYFNNATGEIIYFAENGEVTNEKINIDAINETIIKDYLEINKRLKESNNVTINDFIRFFAINKKRV